MKMDSPQRVNMTRIIEAAEQGMNITRNLQNLSRMKPSAPRALDANQTIVSLETFLRKMLGEGIKLESVYSEAPLKVIADGGELQQVITNLVSNAMHAMPDGGTLKIITTSIAIDAEFIKLHGFGTSGNYALISLADTGTGMDRKTIHKIFDPFFTTRVHGQKNFGLGLSIVYSIIAQHNGFIDVCSKPDKGSTFRLYLPLIATDNTQKNKKT
jgi:signal transduction histidine kinase